MPKYQYTARNNQGQTVANKITAANQVDAREKLHGMGLIPVTITQLRAKKGKESGGFSFAEVNSKVEKFTSRISLDDIVFFTRQVSTFLDASVPLAKSIKNIADAQKNAKFRGILTKVYNDINEGKDFSSALEEHPSVFDQMYVNIIRSGEASGHLDKSLRALANYKEKTSVMQKKIKSALMYPKFVVIFTIAVVIVLMLKVIPVFEELFSSSGVDLPFATQILVDTSRFVQEYFLWLLLLAIALWIGKIMAFKTKAVNNVWDRFVINVPIFGPLVNEIIVERITSTFALLQSSGTSIVDSLKISAKVASNNEYEKSLVQATNDVKNGINLSEAFRRANRFDDIMIQLTETGEETGKIDELMDKIALYYNEKVETKIKGFQSLIEPLLIVFMGLVVGSIVVAIYLPIFSMGKTLG